MRHEPPTKRDTSLLNKTNGVIIGLIAGIFAWYGLIEPVLDQPATLAQPETTSTTPARKLNLEDNFLELARTFRENAMCRATHIHLGTPHGAVLDRIGDDFLVLKRRLHTVPREYHAIHAYAVEVRDLLNAHKTALRTAGCAP